MSRRSRGGRPRGGRPPGPTVALNPVAPTATPLSPAAAPAPVEASDEPRIAAETATAGAVPELRANGGAGDRHGGGCTAPQLRRFIKSRVYVPLHELRRRFGIEGTDDDVNPLELDSGRIFVGLPAAEARLLQELLRGGDVGFELSRDPATPIVVGVYPMRPVARN